jgi:hypothetical protein
MYSSRDSLPPLAVVVVVVALPVVADADEDEDVEEEDPGLAVLLKIDDPSNAEVDVDGEHSNFAKFRIGSTREKNDLCVKLPVVVEVVGVDGIDGGVILSGMILLVNLCCS